MNPVPYQFWIDLWRWVLTIGLGFYFLVVIVVVPFGAFDIKRLFARLDAERAARDSAPNEK